MVSSVCPDLRSQPTPRSEFDWTHPAFDDQPAPAEEDSNQRVEDMERRAHSSKDYAKHGGPSRMMQDFSICSRYFNSHTSIEKSSTQGWAASNLQVGIIGAGIAGLRCAEVLIGGGIGVTLLEARDRIGGRIHQATLVDRLVDLGPSWVHGTDNNVLLDLAKKTDSHLGCPDEDANVYDAHGHLLNHRRVSEGFEVIWEILAEAFRYSNENCEHISPDASLKDFFKEALQARQLHAAEQTFIMELAETWGAFVGDAFEKQSLKWFWLEECLDGGDSVCTSSQSWLTNAENLFISNTHRPIIDSIAKSIMENADVQLSTVVKGIQSQSRKESNRKIIVETTNGTREFDQIVVAIPLGCLKKEMVDFQPPLPSDLKSAIAAASYSGLEKVYIAFPEAFWESHETGRNDDGGHFPGKEFFPTFTHFLQSNYVPEKQQSWTIEMVSLSSSELHGVYSQPVLLFELWDDAAEQVTSAITGLAPDSSEYRMIIREFFKPFYSRLPGYQEDSPICTPTAVLATTWRKDKFAGYGSYTNFKTYLDGKPGEPGPLIDEGVRLMRKGLPERGIWFAGEHTAPFVTLGTSTGAYCSGEVAARRIIEAHGVK